MTAGTETDWPYDADRADPLTAFRIPVVGSAWPRWNYIVAFDSGRLDDDQHLPDDREAAALRSFLEEYIAHWYNPRRVKKMPSARSISTAGRTASLSASGALATGVTDAAPGSTGPLTCGSEAGGTWGRENSSGH